MKPLKPTNYTKQNEPGCERCGGVVRIQVCGEWLCHDHYQVFLDRERASVNLAVRRGKEKR